MIATDNDSCELVNAGSEIQQNVYPSYFYHENRLSGPTMDSTSHVEISRMENANYSKEIIVNSEEMPDSEKLEKLKLNNPEAWLEECERQIKKKCQSIEAINVHTVKFNVLFLITIGTRLNEVDSYFADRSKYIQWLRSRFGLRHMRYFQHARQLARMGDFAKTYASLGKNRLLEVDRLRKGIKLSCEEIFAKHPFKDTTQDLDGALTKEHVDSVLSLYKLNEAGIDFVIYEQAAIIASSLHQAIPINKAKHIGKWLSGQENQEKAFDDYLQNRLVFPDGSDTVPREKRLSLNSILAKLVSDQIQASFDDQNWIDEQKTKISEESLRAAYQVITTLALKLDISLSSHLPTT